MLATISVFSQADGYIPEELLRPRKEEAPRYPIDVVIGVLGQGQASKEAYEFARKVSAALLAGDMNVPVLSSVNSVFLESCMSILEQVNPRFFRLGGGRPEADGSVSFLVRFAGREQGITGELFIRLEEPRRPPAVEAATEQEPAPQNTGVDSEHDSGKQPPAMPPPTEPPPPPARSRAQAPAASTASSRIWVFEDLILEEPRSRETENAESRHRFDFPPYERFF